MISCRRCRRSLYFDLLIFPRFPSWLKYSMASFVLTGLGATPTAACGRFFCITLRFASTASGITLTSTASLTALLTVSFFGGRPRPRRRRFLNCNTESPIGSSAFAKARRSCGCKCSLLRNKWLSALKPPVISSSVTMTLPLAFVLRLR